MTFKIKMALPTNNYSQYQFDLRFLNNIGPNYSWKEYNSWIVFSHAGVIPTGKEQNLIFPLRGIPDWSMGGKCHGIKLFLPPRCDIRLISISLPEANTIIPIIKNPSVIKLNRVCDEQIVHYDASHIKDCAQIVLEVVGPNEDFETLYQTCQPKIFSLAFQLMVLLVN